MEVPQPRGGGQQLRVERLRRAGGGVWPPGVAHPQADAGGREGTAAHRSERCREAVLHPPVARVGQRALENPREDFERLLRALPALLVERLVVVVRPDAVVRGQDRKVVVRDGVEEASRARDDCGEGETDRDVYNGGLAGHLGQ